MVTATTYPDSQSTTVSETSAEPLTNTTQPEPKAPVQASIENSDDNFTAKPQPTESSQTGQSVEEMAQDAIAKAKKFLGFEPGDNAKGMIHGVSHDTPDHASMQFGNGYMSLDPNTKSVGGLRSQDEIDEAAALMVKKIMQSPIQLTCLKLSSEISLMVIYLLA